ncbi:hypothetical protein [Trinickia fusca]|uniref:Uncharacterized protein n=1 Tax=Trinickia fusca TaxID=2419777 RepID=A0A494XF74_9BURK|nr:hypothetical protein [Trinickia fusca]RKP49300.1 hypothetical protein D7S89_11050 [Trinickia fusca]
MKEHPLTALIAAHLLGGTTGLDLSHSMTDQEIGSKVSVGVRIAKEIRIQVAEQIAESECLIVAHLLGGTNGLNLSPTMTDQEIESMVSVAVRVLKEMDKQAKQAERIEP